MPLTKLEELDLSDNRLGGDITADVAVFTKLKKLSLRHTGIGGKGGICQHICVVCSLTFSLFAGELPKLLPISLEVLDLGVSFGSINKFRGVIPSEWGALTNLMHLKMGYCGLGGKICMSQYIYMRCVFADIVAFWQEYCPRSSASSST